MNFKVTFSNALPHSRRLSMLGPFGSFWLILESNSYRHDAMPDSGLAFRVTWGSRDLRRVISRLRGPMTVPFNITQSSLISP